MICKERDSNSPGGDKFSQAGAKAEEQMTFYLRRAFADDENVRVFNDLRFVDETGDAVQIDHLILHPRGMVLVESKSVTSEVRVNKRLEWVRVWNGRQTGMASPVLQAQRQAEQLKRILGAYREQLRGKVLLGTVQTGFGACPFDLLVAISDSGVVKLEVDVPEVCKADQVVGRIRDIIQRHKRAALLKPLSLKDGMEHFSEEETKKITDFFLTYHCPLSPSSPSVVEEPDQEQEVPAPPQPASPPPQPPVPVPADIPSTPHTVAGLGACQKCGTQSTILWGKFGYYWKCPACGSNTPLREYCPTCKGKVMLRKQKSQFFKHCDTCHTPESLYWEAPG